MNRIAQRICSLGQDKAGQGHGIASGAFRLLLVYQIAPANLIKGLMTMGVL
jgi:hypothetical protein